MILKLNPRFIKNVEGRFGKYHFEVGILENGPHKPAKGSGSDPRNIGAYAGGSVRKLGRETGGMPTIAEVSAANRERLGFNYLAEPFKNKSSDIIKFSNEFFKLVFGRSEKKRAENLLQAIVRNPILRGEYGKQAKSTTREKGFYRPMIDTAQLFKAIKAVCRVRGGR